MRRLNVFTYALAALLCSQHATASSKTFVDERLGPLAEDWTPLSPRANCLRGAGMKSGGSTGLVKDPSYRYRSNPAAIWPNAAKLEQSIAALNRDDPRDISEPFERRINYWANIIGPVAADPEPDTRLLRRLLEELNTIKQPDVAQSQYRNVIARSAIRRMCVNAYVSEAYGLGSVNLQNVYREASKIWKQYGFDTYFPKELVELNYIASRDKLINGDTGGAFQNATDPVMSWAVQRGQPFAAKWVATFYALGIGTPRSAVKALEIYQRSGQKDDKIDAALIKASLGRKVEAVSDLQTLLKSEWNGSQEYKRASSIYAELTGSRWQDPRRAGLIEAMLAVPVVILAICVDNPALCAGNNTSGASTNAATSDREEWKAHQRSCAQNLAETVYLGVSAAAC